MCLLPGATGSCDEVDGLVATNRPASIVPPDILLHPLQ